MYRAVCILYDLDSPKTPEWSERKILSLSPSRNTPTSTGSCVDPVSAYGLTHPLRAHNLLRYSAIIGDESRFRFLRGKFSFSFDLSFVLICVFFTLITYQPRLTLTLRNLHPVLVTYPVITNRKT